MERIGIITCGQVMEKCTANGCLRSFNEKSEGFAYLSPSSQLVAFGVCSGQIDKIITKFNKAEVENVHLSTCIRGRCDHYLDFAKTLSKYFNVMGYTHGSEKGKKCNNIEIKRGYYDSK